MMPIFIFIMVMAAVSVTAKGQATEGPSDIVSTIASDSNNYTSTFNSNTTADDDAIDLPTNTTDMNSFNNTVVLTTTAAMNFSITNSTSTTPSDEVSREDKVSKAPMSTPTPTPERFSSVHTPTAKPTTSKATQKKPTTPKQSTAGSDITGVIILIVIVIVAIGFAVACYVARRRGRRYSVDFSSRPDEANIPLSTVEPDLPLDNAPQNGLQTFESKEPAEKEPEEQEEKPEVQEEQKAEADKSEASAETAAPPPPDSSEDKPKEDVAEESPPAPAEPSMEEKTDEGAISNKTSTESLKETNENNSNNVNFSWMRDLKSSNVFWDVPLDSPV